MFFFLLLSVPSEVTPKTSSLIPCFFSVQVRKEYGKCLRTHCCSGKSVDPSSIGSAKSGAVRPPGRYTTGSQVRLVSLVNAPLTSLLCCVMHIICVLCQYFHLRIIMQHFLGYSYVFFFGVYKWNSSLQFDSKVCPAILFWTRQSFPSNIFIQD